MSKRFAINMHVVGGRIHKVNELSTAEVGVLVDAALEGKGFTCEETDESGMPYMAHYPPHSIVKINTYRIAQVAAIRKQRMKMKR